MYDSRQRLSVRPYFQLQQYIQECLEWNLVVVHPQDVVGGGVAAAAVADGGDVVITTRPDRLAGRIKEISNTFLSCIAKT